LLNIISNRIPSLSYKFKFSSCSSIGNRNDLPACYAAFSLELHYDSNEGLYIGGQFRDGRAADLVELAKGPFLNFLEMANPDEKSVVEKVQPREI